MKNIKTSCKNCPIMNNNFKHLYKIILRYRKTTNNTYPINPPCLVRLKSPINAAEERLMNELSLEFPFSVLEED